jgi:hypothetical protein
VVRELPAMSTPEIAEFERRANQARPFLYCTLSSVVAHLQKRACEAAMRECSSLLIRSS